MGPVPNCLIFSQGVLVPENTGCQPVVAGNFVQSSFAPRILKSASKSLVSASCRDLQAGSLRSPKAHLAQLSSARFFKPIACWSKNATPRHDAARAFLVQSVFQP